MKKYALYILVFLMTLNIFAGCAANSSDDSDALLNLLVLFALTPKYAQVRWRNLSGSSWIYRAYRQPGCAGNFGASWGILSNGQTSPYLALQLGTFYFGDQINSPKWCTSVAYTFDRIDAHATCVDTGGTTCFWD